ncbi:MAG: hypothetical protein WC496_10320 [Phycisphaerae bacterium]|jgi:hypothetical protein
MPNWKYIWYDIEERLEKLGIRKWINNNPKIIIGISIVSAVIFLLIVITLLIPSSPPIMQSHKAWFYDLNTNELFIRNDDRIPPIDAPSGKLPDGEPAGVKAYVFTYFSDPNDSELFIGFLEKYTPQGKEIISLLKNSKDNVTKEMIRQLNNNRFVRRLEDDSWFLADSNEGQAILEQASRANEKGKIPDYYPPK